jgi:heat shock protein HtpX
LYINDDEAPNAFATGRKTICVTNGLLSMPDNQIRATLGHEFGHLAHKDTDLILIVTVGNFIITAVITVIRVLINVMQMIFGIICIFMGGAEGAVASITNSLCNLLINIFVMGFMWLWTKIGIILVMKSSRQNEYEADKFSFNLGYGNDLCILLDSICATSTKGLFANLVSSHPDKNDRILKLQELGVTYRRIYQ